MRGVVILLAAAVSVPSPGPAADDPIRLLPRQAVLYEGSVTISQTLGDKTPEPVVLRLALLLRAREDGPGKLRVTAVRRAQAASGDDPPIICFDELAGESLATLAPTEDAVAEQDERVLGISPYLGFDPLPAFAIPAAGGESRQDAELLFLGLVRIKAPVTTRLTADGGRRRLTRELAAGASPTFDFRERQSALTSWTEVYELEAGGNLPARVVKTVGARVATEEGEVKLERRLELEARKVIAPDGPDAAATEALDAELRGIGADFAAFVEVARIHPRIEAFEKAARGTVYELAVAGLKARSESYKDLRLGKPADDFTLEGLDGKQVTFREATRGKVVFLTFWGVG